MSSGTPRRGAVLFIAAVGAAVVAVLLVGDGSRLMLPFIHHVLEALMPEFSLRSVRLVTHHGGTTIAAEFVSREYIVLAGRAWRPGLVVHAETPAAQLVRPILLFGLGALWLHGRREWCARRGLLLAPAVLTLAGLQVPLVLSGQAWALFLGAAEPAARWLLIAVSEALLHGADIALVVLAVFLCRPFHQGSMVLSDHGPTRSLGAHRRRPT